LRVASEVVRAYARPTDSELRAVCMARAARHPRPEEYEAGGSRGRRKRTGIARGVVVARRGSRAIFGAQRVHQRRLAGVVQAEHEHFHVASAREAYARHDAARRCTCIAGVAYPLLSRRARRSRARARGTFRWESADPLFFLGLRQDARAPWFFRSTKKGA
jgi:hypothetical protein